MFTLPVVMAGAWFGWSVSVLLVSWVSMMLSGLLFLQAAQYYPPAAGYHTLVTDLLGKRWAMLNALSILFVLGILTYAYISASGPVYQHSFVLAGLPATLAEAKIILTACVAVVVCLGTKEVSRLMTFCLLAKIALLVLLFGGLLTQVSVPVLLNSTEQAVSYWPFVLAVVPFCLASFGYHGNISGLNSYYSGDRRQVRKAVIYGTSLALVIYLFWMTGTMGNLPRSSFPAIIKQGGDIAALLAALRDHLETGSLSLMMSIFSHFAVVCSFLGVTSGLFDFIADRLKLGDSLFQRLQIAALTFLPPLIGSIAFPDGFIAAIGYAGLFATVWAVFTPALLAVKARLRFNADVPRSSAESIAVTGVTAFGIITILAWLLDKMGLLPVYR